MSVMKQQAESKKEESGRTRESRPPEIGLPGVRNPLISLQQQIGNRAVQRMVAGYRSRIQRQAPADGEAPVEEEPFNTSGLGKKVKLTGHGNLGSLPVPPSAASPPDVQRFGGPVTANPTYTVNPPAITRKPAADIEAAHGRAGVAGWTTPQYDFQVPFANPSRIDFTVTLNFDMELASEYTGDTLSVLQDHEMGHVNIGRDKGQAHLVNDLDAQFEGLAALTPAAIRDARDNAAAVFENEEGNASQDYDTSDYPRMRQAYLGARTPLADLEGADGTIRHMANMLRSFNATVMLATPGQAMILANDVIAARGGLSTDALSTLQYNAEFKSLVATAGSKIDEYIASYHYDLWVVDFSTLPEPTRQALETLRQTLGGFTWVAPV